MRRVSLKNGPKLIDGEGFYADGDGSRFVKLPFCALTEIQIDDAVECLVRTASRVQVAA